jgi:hypothetical protein
MINDYKQKVGTRLVYINDPVNFDTANQGAEFIEGILSRTSSAELKFQDYNEMMRYINSYEYLQRVIDMPDINASQSKCIDYINSLRKDSILSDKVAEMEMDTVKGYNQRSRIDNNAIQDMVNNPISLFSNESFKVPKIKVIWTNKSLTTDYNTWLQKEKQIYIPPDYQYQANKIISKYLGFVGSLSQAQQIQTKAFLDNLKFAETLFKTDKELNNKIILSLLKKFELKSKRYGQNIFFSIVDIDTYEYSAISKMSYWLKIPLNAMFTINEQMVGQGINQILSGLLAKQKAEQAQKRRDEAEESNKANEKKEKEKKDENEKGLKKTYTIEPSENEKLKKIFKDFTSKTENVNNIYGELDNLGVQPDIAALSDMERRVKDLESTYVQAENVVNSSISKLQNSK